MRFCVCLVPPGSPSEVSADKVNKNGARLTWKPPKSDGGTPVTGYIVEKQDESGNWLSVADTKEPTAFIPMREGEKAQFRVIAVNKEGKGEPSRPTGTVVAENKPTVPHIATPDDGVQGGPGSGVGGLQDITIKVGRRAPLYPNN